MKRDRWPSLTLFRMGSWEDRWEDPEDHCLSKWISVSAMSALTSDSLNLDLGQHTVCQLTVPCRTDRPSYFRC